MKPLKIPKETVVRFTSDLHFDHDKEFIWRKRGFNSVDEMNEKMIEAWNLTVSPEDWVFMLGDFKMGVRNSYMSFLSRLSFGKIFLMSGNHFAGLHEVEENERILKIPNYFEILVGGKLICMSHYPIGSWNKLSKGSYQLHGHSHGSYSMTHGRQLDVGMDCFPYPISFETVREKIGRNPIKCVDHHD